MAAGPVHLLGGSICFGLIALNAWWLWEGRPPPDLKALGKLTDPAQVESGLRRRLDASPHDGETRMRLAMHLATLNRPRESAEMLAQVPFFWPSKPLARDFEGRQWLLAGHAAKAERAFRAFLAVDPNHPQERPERFRCENDLIDLLRLEDRWDEVRELVWAIYDRSPPAARPGWVIQALRTRLERSSPTAALPRLRVYAEADPTDWRARRALARAAQAQGDIATADRESLDAVAANPLDVAARRDRLGILKARGDARGVLQAAADLPPDSDNDGETWALRAWAYTQLGDIKAAVDAYRRAAQILPFEPEVAYQLSLVERRRGNPTAAESARRRATSLRDARAAVPKLLTEFYDADQSPDPSRRGPRADAARSLAERCRALGWVRDAEAWGRLPTEF